MSFEVIFEGKKGRTSLILVDIEQKSWVLEAMETLSRNLGGKDAVAELFDDMDAFDEPAARRLS